MADFLEGTRHKQDSELVRPVRFWGSGSGGFGECKAPGFDPIMGL